MTTFRVTGGSLEGQVIGGGVDNTLPTPPPGYVDNTLPTPPPGIWPPLSVSHPIQPVPPSMPVPPGTIWPPVLPVDPGYGLGGAGGGGRPVDPGFGIGEGSPDQGLPPSGEHPSQGLPGRPPRPPRPPRPDQGLPPSSGGSPDQGLPGEPGSPDQGLPPSSGGRPDQGLPSHTFWVVCGIPGIGWRYICVDPSLTIGGGPVLPPTAQPKG